MLFFAFQCDFCDKIVCCLAVCLLIFRGIPAELVFCSRRVCIALLSFIVVLILALVFDVGLTE